MKGTTKRKYNKRKRTINNKVKLIERYYASKIYGKRQTTIWDPGIFRLQILENKECNKIDDRLQPKARDPYKKKTEDT